MKYILKQCVICVGTVLFLGCATNTQNNLEAKAKTTTQGLPIGTFMFDMKSTSAVKENGVTNEALTYLLQNIGKKLRMVTVNQDKSITLSGRKRNGKDKKEKFLYKKISHNKYKISAGFEIVLISTNKLQLSSPMQNGEIISLIYSK